MQSARQSGNNRYFIMEIVDLYCDLYCRRDFFCHADNYLIINYLCLVKAFQFAIIVGVTEQQFPM